VTIAALEAERKLSQEVPGFNESPLVTPLLRAISSLHREREFVLPESRDGGPGISTSGVPVVAGMGLDGSTDPNSEAPDDHRDKEKEIGIEGPLLIIMRHGKTEYNKLGLFTGWEDCPLSKEGREEATKAGNLLNEYGVQIDQVHTSCLSRAIETAWIAMERMDVLWVPIRKTWRLNERMYGGLTGLSKKLISHIHGEAQFKKWRRGFDERPPPVDAFSPHYPGNDQRYVETIKDMPISPWQTLIRSLEARKLLISRRMPRTESLKDCMARTIPYFKSDILKKSLFKEQKNTLVVSSENAIRGLLMELCGVSTEDITSVEIPTGLPMLFDPKTRSIRLLDDGQGGDPLKRYNFGSKPELLFKNGEVFVGRKQPSKAENAAEQEERSVAGEPEQQAASRPALLQ